jgi:hypothetical protein
MKTKLILLTVLFIPCFSFSQGLNNDFDYDKEDLNTILKEIGFVTFKFPVRQDTTQLCDFVIEEYLNGKLVSEKSVITAAQKKFDEYGIDWTKYFKPKKDSIYFHRFYFIKNDTAVTVRLKSHGYSTIEKLDNLGLSLFDLRALEAIKAEIDSVGYVKLNKPKDLIFLYANKSDSKEPLWCPSGLPKKEVIKRFHYVLFISIKEYTKAN